MKKIFLKGIFIAALAAISPSANATSVTIYNMDFVEGDIVNVDTQEKVEITDDYGAYTFDCEPGRYISISEEWGTLIFEIPDQETYSFTMGTTSLGLSAASRSWTEGTDFTIEDLLVTDESGTIREITPYIGEYYIKFLSISNDTYSVRFVPTDLHPEYMTAILTGSTSSNTNMTTFTIPQAKTFTLSFPEDATAELSYKRNQTHYIPFAVVEPEESETVDGTTTNTYRIANSTQQYAYKVRRDNDLTHGALFTGSSLDSAVVTDEELKEYTCRYFDHNIEDNGTNYADIFLNINKRHLLRMNSGENFQIVNLRTWQITNNATANLFVEPDYNWTVLNTEFQPDNSVIEIDSNGVITANAPGTAIVQVRYEALSFGAMNGSLWSEIWAENTGTFVVTVDADPDQAPDDNIRLAYKEDVDLDAEHDIMYYMEDKDGYLLTFTPADGTTVTVANPLVDQINNNVSYPDGFSDKNVTVNSDGSVTALLTYGRNIIRTTDADGNSNYQVLSAKPITSTFTTTRRTDNYLLPGDEATAQFSGLFHTNGKMAGIYNQSCYIKFDGETNGNNPLGSGQYDFAGNSGAQQFPLGTATSEITELTLTTGCLHPDGYGSAPGAHRSVSYETGVNPNLNAGIVSGDFGSIPDQAFEITPIQYGLNLSMDVAVGEDLAPIDIEELKKALGDTYIWISEDPSIASVDADGIITGVGDGIVTVKCYDGQSSDGDSNCIKVVVSVTSIPLENLALSSLPYIEISADGTINTYTLSPTFTPSNASNKKVDWTIDDPEIASVDENGVITPIKPGKTYVNGVSQDGGFTVWRSFYVVQRISGMEISPSSITMAPEDTHEFEMVLTPSTGSYQSQKWSSSNTDVATVDSNGIVTAIAEGEATISLSITAYNYGYDATATVIVDSTSAVSAIESEEGEVIWYNINGVRVKAPQAGTHGIFIRMKNGKSEKVIH